MLHFQRSSAAGRYSTGLLTVLRPQSAI